MDQLDKLIGQKEAQAQSQSFGQHIIVSEADLKSTQINLNRLITDGTLIKTA